METTLHNGKLSDALVIERVLAGDTALFELLVRRYNPVLYKIARSYGYNHQDAEDLMQEAHCKAFKQLKQLEQAASYKSWICKIIVNQCHYKQNLAATRLTVMDDGSISEDKTPLFTRKPDVNNETSRRELSRIIEASILRLPLMYRTVFMFREVEALSVEETANLLGITPTNVKVRCSRARMMLQKELEQYYSAADLFEFNLIYCDAIVERVMAQVK